jgi:hypothetical protein
VNQSTVQKSRWLSYVIGAAALFLAALPGSAANLVDVRIGVHDEYTRVVLETDAKAPYEIESSGSRELVLLLRAGSGNRVFASAKSAHLVSVMVKSAEAGASRIHIALRGPVDVKQFALTAPHRVVLDLRSAPEAAATAPTPAPPIPSPEPAAKVTPEPSPSPARPVTPAAEEAETGEREAAGAAPVAIPEPDPGAVLAAEEEVKKPVPVAPKRSTLPRRVAVPPPPVAEGGILDALPAPLNRPLVLGLIVALLFVIAFVIVRHRGAAGAEEPITPFAAGEPFSVDEQSEVAEQPEGEETDLPAGEASLFDGPVETVEPLEEPQGEAAAMAPDEVPEAPPTGEPGPGPSQELEQRFARLEERLEEVVDGNDRIGRQVAAQTEELRVQRAAIARTQRVLRDLSRAGDEATEPVPKI